LLQSNPPDPPYKELNMSKAEELASYFDNFKKSSHALQDGTPLHIAAKEHLRAIDASHQRLKEALEDAKARMDRARDILTDGKPRPECNWGMLDTNNLIAALEQAKALS
jgi:hypothetical protein